MKLSKKLIFPQRFFPAKADSYTLRNTPERPHKCNLCPSSSFSSEENLSKHKRERHNLESTTTTAADEPASNKDEIKTPAKSQSKK